MRSPTVKTANDALANHSSFGRVFRIEETFGHSGKLWPAEFPLGIGLVDEADDARLLFRIARQRDPQFFKQRGCASYVVQRASTLSVNFFPLSERRDTGNTSDETRDAIWDEIACAFFRVWDLHVCLDHRAPFVSRRCS